MIRHVKNILTNVILLILSSVFISFTLFVFFEFFPKMPTKLGLNKIHYYALKERYREDQDLVLRMKANYRYQGLFTGDIVGLGSKGKPVPYIANYDHNGFRNDSAPQKADVVFLGDSFIEFGLNSGDTVPSRVEKTTGKKAANLALGWYGPNQYLIALEKYGVKTQPKDVFFCFFEGNDLRDMRQFAKWKGGGDYYHFSILSKNFLMKYLITIKDITVHIAKLILRRWDERKVTILLDGEPKETVFVYNTDPRTENELLASNEVTTLKNIFIELQDMSEKNGFNAHIVFIPSKSHIYLPLLTASYQMTYEENLRDRDVLEGIIRKLAQDANLGWISLTAPFNDAIMKGNEVYYLSDTHWNEAGRKIAAESLTKALNH